MGARLRCRFLYNRLHIFSARFDTHPRRRIYFQSRCRHNHRFNWRYFGACAAFLVGRTIARDWIARKVSQNEKFAAIDNAVARQGFKIVLLTRLSPVFPFNLLNYAFGLTKVSFWKYALASWIGMLPGTVMYVYFGAGLRSLTDVAAGKVETGTAGRIFFWFGMAVTIAVTIFITFIARKALKQVISENTAEKS